ncbi:MAG: diphosphomevalonate decarboxylase [Bdellovibrionales bacterium]|jgi:diphosphomevalonate decarboxylase|nr:diphosphomevalonate decarboxylase [Bdellovibrionales bacterium]
MSTYTEQSNLFNVNLSEIPEKKEGNISWSSPSNIALIKYWGKYGNQLPCNPSLSLTLEKSRTIFNVKWKYNSKNKAKKNITFNFKGKDSDSFQERIEKVITIFSKYLPYLNYCQLEIYSENTFPHSAGIASSASSMSSLALCLLSIGNKLNDETESHDSLMKRASFLSRLASGSACRSLFPYASLWGVHQESGDGSLEFGTPFIKMHDIFKTIQDSILVIDSGPKNVSSSLGHSLMSSNPYSEIRFKNASRNLNLLTGSMQEGDLFTWGEIIESEALDLHAMMMVSRPSFILLKPNSLSIINKVREFRDQTKLPVFFTLDAGPNIHLLYPMSIKQKVVSFIEKELSMLLENNEWIDDQIGQGPYKIESFACES